MLIALWSPKGGCGTTVVATALALIARSASDVLLVDLAGDVPVVLGLPDPAQRSPGERSPAERAGRPGVADWLGASHDVPTDALARLEIEVAPGLRLLPCGSRPEWTGAAEVAARADVLTERLAQDGRTVVVDCGRAERGAPLAVAAGATVSLLVMRPCYVALRRALDAPVRPSGVVLVTEPQRAITRADVEAVLDVPVTAEIAHDATIARAVDAGLLAGRLPRPLQRALRSAA